MTKKGLGEDSFLYQARMNGINLDLLEELQKILEFAVDNSFGRLKIVEDENPFLEGQIGHFLILDEKRFCETDIETYAAAIAGADPTLIEALFEFAREVIKPMKDRLFQGYKKSREALFEFGLRISEGQREWQWYWQEAFRSGVC